MQIYTLPAILSYAILIVALSYLYRSGGEYRDFAIGNRSFGWFVTACALFTLIGGGELIAGASFGYEYGWFGVALFIGYTISFIILGARAPAFFPKFDKSDVSYADYALRQYGRFSGNIVLISQLIAFFALIVLQFAAAGTLVTQLAPISYNGAIIACACAVCFYLLIGGFRAVSITDVVQGAVMLLLIIVVGYLIGSTNIALQTPRASNYPGFDGFWGVALSGIIIGLASADVWQRMIAARSAQEARLGFVLGGLMLGAYGSLIVYVGILTRAAGLANQADAAFLSLFTSGLPTWLVASASLATLAAILSTADTEIFLVSTLLERTFRYRENDNGRPFNKTYLILVSATAAMAATIGHDLAALYNWMFVLYMIVAPSIALGVFVNLSAAEFAGSLVGSVVLSAVLLVLSKLTLDNSYLLAAPALALGVYRLSIASMQRNCA